MKAKKRGYKHTVQWCEDRTSGCRSRLSHFRTKLEALGSVLKLTCAPEMNSILKGLGNTLIDFEDELQGIETDLYAIQHAFRESHTAHGRKA